MTLSIAVQMDHISTVNIAGDTTFALSLEAQRRGHALFQHGRIPRQVDMDQCAATLLEVDAFTTRFSRYEEAQPTRVEGIAGVFSP